MVFDRVFRRSLSAVLPAVLLAGCASTAPREAATPRPHYKIGAPYEVSGKRYIPREEPGYEAIGVASWYGDAFNGKPTANGEIFDKNRLSAAHTTLPLPSLVEVENLENGRKAVVRVNDRGPFARNRIIDLSHAAAIELGFERAGLARVRVKYVGRADLQARAPTPREARAMALSSPAAATPPQTASVGAPLADRDRLAEAIAAAIDDDAPPATGAFWITVAEFEALSDLKIDGLGLKPGEEARVASHASPGGKPVYAYEIGPFATMSEADTRLALLRDAGYPDAWISTDRAVSAGNAD